MWMDARCPGYLPDALVAEDGGLLTSYAYPLLIHYQLPTL
jgi:hypothetical protein